MGKHGKKQSADHRRGKKTSYTLQENEEGESHDYPLNPSPLSDSDQESQEEEDNQETSTGIEESESGLPSKFSLYQQSVQVSREPFCYPYFLRYVWFYF